MKFLIGIILILFSAPIKAHGENRIVSYLDLGIGYVDEAPIEAEATASINGIVVIETEQQASVRVQSPYLLAKGGLRYNAWHLEYEIKGFGSKRAEALHTVQIYYRKEF